VLCTLLAVVLALAIFFSRQVHATPDEQARTLPGDDLIPHPLGSVNHAITIRRSPQDGWPWLVQMGSGRDWPRGSLFSSVPHHTSAIDRNAAFSLRRQFRYARTRCIICFRWFVRRLPSARWMGGTGRKGNISLACAEVGETRASCRTNVTRFSGLHSLWRQFSSGGKSDETRACL